MSSLFGLGLAYRVFAEVVFALCCVLICVGCVVCSMLIMMLLLFY